MAFYVGIKKIRELNDKEAVYEVESYDNLFLIKINIAHKTIEIMNGSNNPSYIIDFNDPEKEINIEWLSGKTINALIIKSKKVIDAKTFFDDISLCS